MQFRAKILSVILGLSICGCTLMESETSPTNTGMKEDSSMTFQLIELISNNSFEETVERLRAGIEKRPLKLFAEIDHAKGAASADLALEPSTLFIFGNPKGGTPLMAQEPRMGIVLPLKMHVYQAGDKVMISYSDMATVAESYGLNAQEQPIPNIAAMLNDLAAEGAK